jgi:hypothetical protein
MEDARDDLDGTLAVLSSLVDHNIENAADHIVAMERYLKADLASLSAAIGEARESILTPLHARRAYDAPDVPEEAQAAAERSSPVALVVDNGGDHAA